MDWFKIVSNYYTAGIYTAEDVKVFADKRKISVDEFKKITGKEIEV